MTNFAQTMFALAVVTGDRVTDRLALRLRTLKDDERGASAVEYALLVGFIAVAVVAAVAVFRTKLMALFNSITLPAAS